MKQLYSKFYQSMDIDKMIRNASFAVTQSSNNRKI
jgi:hypothetical protein